LDTQLYHKRCIKVEIEMREQQCAFSFYPYFVKAHND